MRGDGGMSERDSSKHPLKPLHAEVRTKCQHWANDRRAKLHYYVQYGLKELYVDISSFNG
jgi:hypothetical protein